MASLLFIRRLFASQNRVVEYRPNGGTRCPVCEFCGLEHVAPMVTSTVGEVRYCTCPQCLIDFRASGPTAAEVKAQKAEEEKKIVEIEKQIKKKSVTKKKKGDKKCNKN